VVEIPHTITVKDLCDKLGVTPAAVIKELISARILATVNQSIDFETAATVARNLGAEVLEVQVPSAASAAAKDEVREDLSTGRATRPPVVTIMGHVDHGKTSLLDAIRVANDAARDEGGITQHIGAYQVEIKGQKITFLDTPGHEAFTAMRARGAKATDIAVLVVAADDGVQPQTLEAINHARAAKVPIVVAINKVDRADAQPDRVKQQLSDAGLIVEEWGGDIVAVEVSARQKRGIEHLLEMILLVAEIQELKANANRPAEGVVIEAKLDRNRGPLATVLIQEGTLRPGDNVVAGATYGKVRAMFNDQGKRLKKADPAMPVEVLGLVGVPAAGDGFRVVEDERAARGSAQDAANRVQAEGFAASRATSLEDIASGISAGEVKDLNIIIKTDVQGSAQPIRESLERLSNDEVKVQVIHVGTGNVTESDILLAQASRAIVVGFNVRVEPGAQRLAEATSIDIRIYSVIYNVIEDVQKALTGMLEPKFRDIVEGHAEVRQVFRVGRTGNIAGCSVLDGRISRGSTIRLLRGGKSIFEGKLSSLRRFKDDVRDVAAGYECGLGLEGFNEFEAGDVLESVRRERDL
jgi:translation initiation factor IF-2